VVVFPLVAVPARLEAVLVVEMPEATDERRSEGVAVFFSGVRVAAPELPRAELLFDAAVVEAVGFVAEPVVDAAGFRVFEVLVVPVGLEGGFCRLDVRPPGAVVEDVEAERAVVEVVPGRRAAPVIVGFFEISFFDWPSFAAPGELPEVSSGGGDDIGSAVGSSAMAY
jgi:hypothetical protein